MPKLDAERFLLAPMDVDVLLATAVRGENLL
jgi:hypothetical protein